MTEIIKETDFNKNLVEIINTARSTALEETKDLLDEVVICETIEKFSREILEKIFLSAIGFKRDRYSKDEFEPTDKGNNLEDLIKAKAKKWVENNLSEYIENYKPSQKLLKSMKRTFEERLTGNLEDAVYRAASDKADKVIHEIEDQFNGNES